MFTRSNLASQRAHLVHLLVGQTTDDDLQDVVEAMMGRLARYADTLPPHHCRDGSRGKIQILVEVMGETLTALPPYPFIPPGHFSGTSADEAVRPV